MEFFSHGAYWIWATCILAPVGWIFARDSDLQELKMRTLNMENRQIEDGKSLAQMDGKMEVLLTTMRSVEVNVQQFNRNRGGQGGTGVGSVQDDFVQGDKNGGRA